jgi:predicted dehydrogenase
MLKIAIVGCGKIADGHVEQIQRMPELAEVVAVCDRELLLAEQLAARYGIARHHDDFETMLSRERPDVVHIATPPGSHLPLARTALDADCHIFVEKPLAPSLADTLAIVEAAETAGRKLTVGYTYLFDPAAEGMREQIAAGTIGEVVHVESFYGYDLRGPFGSALLADGDHWVHALPGGLLFNNIDHLLNKLCEFIADDEPSLHAIGYRRAPKVHGDARDALLDELRVMIGGAEVSAYATFSSHIRPAAHSLTVYGSEGTLMVDHQSRVVCARQGVRLPSAIGRVVPPLSQAAAYLREGARNVGRFARADFHFFAGLELLIRRFYQSICDGGPPPIASRDILRVARWMHAIVAQLEPRRSRAQEVA